MIKVCSSIQNYLVQRTKDLNEDLQAAGEDQTKVSSIKDRIHKLYVFSSIYMICGSEKMFFGKMKNVSGFAFFS